MKREIKFRVWDERYNCWDNCSSGEHFCLYPKQSLLSQGRIFQQFTGLKDKNGKEIYEGDIICIPENDPTSTSGNALLTVEYRYGGFGYVDPTNKKFENIYYLIGDVDVDDCAEVVGNIFENPELLK